MNDHLTTRLLHVWLTLTAPRQRDERGDVPGWVMVTVMTVALAMAIFEFAGPGLQALLDRAFASVE